MLPPHEHLHAGDGPVGESYLRLGVEHQLTPGDSSSLLSTFPLAAQLCLSASWGVDQAAAGRFDAALAAQTGAALSGLTSVSLTTVEFFGEEMEDLAA